MCEKVMEEQYNWISIVLIAVKNMEHKTWDLFFFFNFTQHEIVISHPWRYEAAILRCIKFQMSADLIYTGVETWNRAS
jgi:hypothetical protein